MRKSGMKIWIRHIFLVPVYIYRYLLSPVLPKSCRYYPSCSQYAVQAVMVHGICRGTWLAVRRIARCHPWAEGGVDPVPLPKQQQNTTPTQPLTKTATHENQD